MRKLRTFKETDNVVGRAGRGSLKPNQSECVHSSLVVCRRSLIRPNDEDLSLGTSVIHPNDEDFSLGTPVIHPNDEDLSLGTPVIHPNDEDLSLGTPVMVTST